MLTTDMLRKMREDWMYLAPPRNQEAFACHPANERELAARIAGDVELWTDPVVPRDKVMVSSREEMRRFFGVLAVARMLQMSYINLKYGNE